LEDICSDKTSDNCNIKAALGILLTLMWLNGAPSSLHHFSDISY